MRHLSLSIDTFPIAGSFRIAHGSVTDITVVTVQITRAGYVGRAECRPYARYNESAQSVSAQINAIANQINSGLSREQLQETLPAGAARNAVDCALWDLEAKMAGVPVWELMGVKAPKALQTAYTLSIDTPQAMAKAAIEAHQYGLLKMKIKDISGLEAAQRIIKARPDIRLIIDANEALSPAELAQFRASLEDAPIAMIEQPIAARDLTRYPQDPDMRPVLCADESLHTRADLEDIWDAGYRAVNIKLDKCGGLTEGLALYKAAKARGFQIMAGCMVGSSLAMAPMLMLAGMADIVDLDGPVLLSKDREHALKYEGGYVHPPRSDLWG